MASMGSALCAICSTILQVRRAVSFMLRAQFTLAVELILHVYKFYIENIDYDYEYESRLRILLFGSLVWKALSTLVYSTWPRLEYVCAYSGAYMTQQHMCEEQGGAGAWSCVYVCMCVHSALERDWTAGREAPARWILLRSWRVISHVVHDAALGPACVCAHCWAHSHPRFSPRLSRLCRAGSAGVLTAVFGSLWWRSGGRGWVLSMCVRTCIRVCVTCVCACACTWVSGVCVCVCACLYVLLDVHTSRICINDL